MKLNYNVTGADRKKLVTAISQELNAPTKYLGAPTFAYEIGEYHIDKTGTVTGPDNRGFVANLCGLHSFTAVAEEYETSPPETPEPSAFENLQMDEREELGLGRTRRGHSGEDGMQASDVPDDEDFDYGEAQHYPGRYDDPNQPVTEETLRQAESWMEDQTEYDAAGEDSLAVEMPLDGFTDEAFTNLEKLIASKAGLIKKSLGVETLTVEKAEHRLRFPWFKPGLEQEVFTAYAWFISTLCNAAKEQKRVTAKEKPVDNEKFTFRVFLIRLGFVGSEYKAARKILLHNLTGNSAFKNGAPSKTNESEESSNE